MSLAKLLPIVAGLAWALAAFACLRRARGHGAWWAAALGTLTLGSLDVWRWHVHLYHAGRELLHALDAYADRSLIKPVGVVLAFFLAVIVLRLTRRMGNGARWVALGLLLRASFYVLLVFSLAEWIPAEVREEPNRSLWSIGAAALVAIGALRRDDEDDD